MTTWTPATKRVETWTIENSTRVFDPNVFDRAPIFDTGLTGGIWDGKSIQAETWTRE